MNPARRLRGLVLYADKPDEFILAVVIIDQATTAVRYCRTPFEREADFKATSVNYDLDKLLALAQEPA
jgi:hypothetical protein